MFYKFTLKDRPTPLYLWADDFSAAFASASAFGEVTTLTDDHAEVVEFKPALAPSLPERPYAFGALPPKAPAPQQRTPQDLKLLEETITAYVETNPGLRIEQIAAAVGRSTAEAKLPLRRLVESGVVVTIGHTRATRYFAKVLVKNADTVAEEFGCARSSVERYIKRHRIDGEGDRVLMTPRSISYLGRFVDRKSHTRSMREALASSHMEDD